MRRYFVGGCAAAFVLGASLHAVAQSPGTPDRSVRTISSAIAALLREFPAGGPWLRAAVARLVKADPALAPDAVLIAGIANACQAQAILQGLADAADAFAKVGSAFARDAEWHIRIVLASSGPDTRTGKCLPQEAGLAQGAPGFSNVDASPGGCVSPSRPGC